MAPDISFTFSDQRTNEYLSCTSEVGPFWGGGPSEEGQSWAALFDIRRYGPNGYYQIVNVVSGMALAVEPAAPPDTVSTIVQTAPIPYTNPQGNPAKGFGEAAQSWIIVPHTGSVPGEGLATIYSLQNLLTSLYLSNDGGVDLIDVIDLAVRFEVGPGNPSGISVQTLAYDSPPNTVLIVEGTGFSGQSGPFQACVTGLSNQTNPPVLSKPEDGPSPVLTVNAPTFVSGQTIVAILVEDSTQKVVSISQR